MLRASFLLMSLSGLEEDRGLSSVEEEKSGVYAGEGSSSSSSYDTTYKKEVSCHIDTGHTDISRDTSLDSRVSGATTASMVSSNSSAVGPTVGMHTHLILSNSSPRLVAATKAAVVEDAQARLGADNRHHKVYGVKGAQASSWVLFKMNLQRAWIQERRERVGLMVQTATNVTMGILFGLLYLHQIPHDNGRNTAGFLFSLLVTMLIASSINVCLSFPFDFSIHMREYYSGANRPAPYFLGRTLSSIPHAMLVLLMGIIPYYMAGLAPSGAAFGRFCLILFLSNFSAQSLGYLVSSFTSNPVVAIAILPLANMPVILFSGMLYERHSVPTGLQWIQDISCLNYSFGLLILNQVEAVGGEVRKFLQEFLQVEAQDFPKFLVNLAVLALAYRVVAMCVLMIRVRFLSKPQ